MTEPRPSPSPSDHELEALAVAARQETGAAGVAIALETDGTVVCRARAGEMAPALGAQAGTGISLEALRSGEVQRCPDTTSDPRVNVEVCRQLGIGAMVVVPVLRDGWSVGVVSAFWEKAGAFGDDAVRALQTVAAALSGEIPGHPQAESPATGATRVFTAEEPPVESWMRRAVPALMVAAALVLVAFALLLYRANSYRAAVKTPEQAPEINAGEQGPSPPPPPPTRTTPPSTPAAPASFIDSLRASAEAGDIKAQLALAHAYEQGKEVEADPVRACAWFIVAASNGSREANAPLRELTSRLSPAQIAATRYELGQMYAGGRGVKPDRVTAYMWFILAGEGGNRRATLGMDILRRFMTPDEIQTANQRASDWLAKHRAQR